MLFSSRVFRIMSRVVIVCDVGNVLNVLLRMNVMSRLDGSSNLLVLNNGRRIIGNVLIRGLSLFRM